MENNKIKQIIEVADYIIEHDCTMKEAASHFKIGETKIAYWIHNQLRDWDLQKFNLIREGFKRHNSNKKVKKIIWHKVGENIPNESFVVVLLENNEIHFAIYYPLTNDFCDDKGNVIYPTYWKSAKDMIPKSWINK